MNKLSALREFFNAFYCIKYVWLQGCPACLKAYLPSLLPQIFMGCLLSLTLRLRSAFSILEGSFNLPIIFSHTNQLAHLEMYDIGSKWVECCITQLPFLFYANSPKSHAFQQPLCIFPLMLHSACGLAAAQFLPQDCLHSGVQPKGCSPLGTRYCHGKEKGRWFSLTRFCSGRTNHMPKAEVNGIIQEGQQVTENNTGQHRPGREDPMYIYWRPRLPKQPGSWKAPGVCFAILYHLGRYRWSSESMCQPLFMGHPLLTTWWSGVLWGALCPMGDASRGV